MASEISQRAVHSAESTYFKLLERFPAHVADFNRKWESWQQAISPSSNSSNWSTVAEFNALKALGPKAVPLVLWRLVLDQEDTTAVYLYNHLERDLEYTAGDDTDQAGKVSTILDKNFTRNRLIRNSLLDWAEHCDMVSIHSNMEFYTECDEFEALVGIGPPVIPQLLLQYKNGEPVFGYELMHEIVWGYKAEHHSMNPQEQFKIWADWFEHKNYDDAPRYPRPTQASE